MRTSALQNLYLQKPLLLLIFISVLSVLCWTGMGEFYTKGEPREASVAVSMVKDGNWILPQVYADEFAYKPPMTHWIMALFSLPQKDVTPLTSRLPSAISFIALVASTFVFFGKRLRFQEAFLACLILLTSFELHRAAMTARVDMVLTFFMVLGLYLLFAWEEKKQLKGFPAYIPLVLGLAALTKGPVGIILPLLIFGIYLLIQKYNFWKIAGKLFLVACCALIFPAIWYILAYKAGGKEFIDLVWAENFGRFLGSNDLNINYSLGHEEPVWYNLVSLIAGFIPWSILLLLSLFGIRFSMKIKGLKKWVPALLALPKIKLFSLISAVVIFIFFSIPISKRSVYMMPAYPFIAIFIAQYVLYLVDYKAKISRIFSLIIGILGGLVAVITLLTVLIPGVSLTQIAGRFTHHARTLSDIEALQQALQMPWVYYALLFGLLVTFLSFLFYYLKGKKQLKLLYTTIGVYLSIFIVADGIYLPAFKNGTSIKPVAEQLNQEFHLDQNKVFVMNNLLEYSNMYSLNFYLHNQFRSFEKEKPQSGFFIAGKGSFEKVTQKYGDRYNFNLLKEIKNPNRDGEKTILLLQFSIK